MKLLVVGYGGEFGVGKKDLPTFVAPEHFQAQKRLIPAGAPLGLVLFTVDIRVGLAGQGRAVLLKSEAVFLLANLCVELGLPRSCDVGWEYFGGRCRGPRAGLTASLRNNLDRADLRVLDLRSEGDLDPAVGDFDRDRLHVGLQRPAGFDPNVEVLELVPLDVEGKHALARSGDAVEGLCEMQFHQVFPVGHRPRKGIHAVVFRTVEVRAFRVGNLDVGPLDGLAALEALVGQPDIALSIFDGLGFSGFDADILRRRCSFGTQRRLASGHNFRFGKVTELCQRGRIEPQISGARPSRPAAGLLALWFGGLEVRRARPIHRLERRATAGPPATDH